MARISPHIPDVLYRRFHALAVIPKTPHVTEKINHWRSSPAVKPPNVLVVGIDSMSRLSFHRTMPETRKVLKEMGAVEMLGYTKVGENTFPNLIAALSGYTEADVRQSCFLSNDVAHDGCLPYYLWERFAQAKYLTAFIEDAPQLSTFNYLKTGFAGEPTDIYFRPFMLAVHQHEPTMYMTLNCLGHESEDQFILRYIDDVVTAFRTHRDTNLPYFLFSWMTSLAHQNLMNAKYSDDVYAQFLKRLILNDTIMLFLSDHGYRFGSIRQTFPGWYEDKLPNLWIYLPPSLRKSHPHWVKSLQINAHRLTSTFDLFSTLSQILDEFSEASPLPNLRDKTSQKEIPRKYGQSLFTQVTSKRKCKDAGIIPPYCACVVPKLLSTNDTRLQKAAETATAHINTILPPQCAKLQLQSVDAGAQVERGEESAKTKTFVVAFQTFPDVLRMNKISTDVSCVHDQAMERLCYCLSNGHFATH